MKRTTKKLLAWILILVLLSANLFGIAESASTLSLPGELGIIEEEAFAGATSLDTVVVPEGTTQIQSRAFADSTLTKIQLPASIAFIAEDAFDGCTELVATVNRDSYAHQYCMDNGINYRLVEELYSIAGLMCEGTEFRVTVTTDEICVLRIEVLNEDSEKALHTVHTGMEPGLDYADVLVPVPVDITLPAYYVLRAVLLDGSGNELCTPYTTIQHTEAFEQFDAMTAEDFADTDNAIVDFGDCGFGVVADGAIPVPGTSRTDDHNTYVIPGTTVPEKGGVIVVTLDDGTQEPVKINSVIKNTDGTTTVTRDPETVLSDLYEVFKLDGTADVGEAAQNGGEARMRAGDGGVSASLSTGFTYGAFSLSVTGTAGVTVKAFYNAALFGEDYIEQQVYLTMSATAKAKVTGSFSLSDIKDAFGNPFKPEIKLWDGPIYLIGAGAVVTALELKISVPLEFSCEASGEYTMTITQKTGYSYTSTNGNIPIKERDTDHDFQIKGSFHLQSSLKINLNAIVLLGILQGGVTGQVGLRVDGTAVPNDTSNLTGSKVHGCSLCCDIDVSLFAEAKANIVLKITERFKQNLLNVTLFSIKATVGKFYFSIINEADSMFGGTPTFGKGKCPNYKYRVNVSTLGYDGNTLTGIPVVITKEGAKKFSGESPCTTYLYYGDYSAEASFDSGADQKAFAIRRDPANVVIQEAALTMSGHITDDKTGDPISGASVAITLYNGETRSTTTDASGFYSFEKLFGTSFHFCITAENYEELNTGIEYSYIATEHTKDFKLTPLDLTADFSGCVIDNITKKPIAGATVEVALSDGTVVSATTGADGMYSLVDLTGLSFKFTVSADHYSTVNSAMYLPGPGGSYTNNFELDAYNNVTNISGCVTDADTGYKLANATVLVTLADGSQFSAQTDDNGCYSITGLEEYIDKIAVAKYQFLTKEMVMNLTYHNPYMTQDFRLVPNIPDPNGIPFARSESWVITDVINASGSLISDGVYFEMGYTGNMDTQTKGEATYNLKGQYSTMSFRAGYYYGEKRDAQMTVIADGNVIYDGYNIKCEDGMKSFSIPVSGVSQLVIRFNSDGYDQTRYVISDVCLSPAPAGDEPTRVSDETFKDICNVTFQAYLLNDYFQMGGYTYQGGYRMKMGYPYSQYYANLGFNLNGEYNTFSFDIARLNDYGDHETDLRSATITIEADGVIVGEYSGRELRWNDVTLPISIDVSGVSQLDINLNSTGYDLLYWGIGNIQMH